MRRIALAFAVALALPAFAATPGQRIILFGGSGASGNSGCSAATAAIARLPAPLTSANVTKFTTAICALAAPVTTAGLTGTLLSNLDFLHIYAVDNTADSLIDLTGHGFNSGQNQVSNIIEFFPNVGWQFVQTGVGGTPSSFMVTGYTPSTQGVNYKLNSASLGLMVANNRTTAQFFCGISDSSTAAVQDRIVPMFTGGITVGSLGSSTVSVSGATTTAKGLWVVSRTSSTNVALYQNGTSIGSSAADTATAVPTHPLLVGACYSNDAGTSFSNFTSDVIAADFAGSGFNAADTAAISAALAPFLAPSVPATVAAAWGFTNQAANYTATGLSDIDMGLTNGPNFNLYLTSFWGAGNPTTSDVTFNGTALVVNPSQNLPLYRPRPATRGNTSSTFQGSISSAGVLTVSNMIGVNPGAQGGTAFNNPILVGQLLAGAGMGVTQPTNGIAITGQLSGTTGGVGTYSLARNPGVVASEVMNGYSSVGQIPLLKAGGYYEFCFAFDPTLAPAAGLVGDLVTLEMNGINSLYGRNFSTVSNSTRMHSGEVDLLQLAPSGVGGSVTSFGVGAIDEFIATDYADWQFTEATPTTSSTATVGNPVFTTKQCMEILWVPTTMNGGTGRMERFINNNRLPTLDVTYSATTNITYGGLGLLFAGESDQWVMFVDGGFGQPLTLFSMSAITK